MILSNFHSELEVSQKHNNPSNIVPSMLCILGSINDVELNYSSLYNIKSMTKLRKVRYT